MNHNEVMKILDISKINRETIIQTACQILASGGLLVYPTETTYGIGVDATNQDAIDKLLQYKARREGKPLSIAVTDQAMAEQYVELNDEARNLYQTFLPGPVTVISMAKAKLAKGAASERRTVGVRIPDYSLARDIIAAYGKPITATSANASYKKRPYAVGDIFQSLSTRQKSLIDLVLDAGELPHNEPSTVIDTTLENPTVLRQGKIKLSQATTVITKSEGETQALAEQLIKQYRHYLNERALIFALIGELGAGKTQFTKGLGKALGVTQPIVSPTFTLSHEYLFDYGDRPNQFIHIDTWRFFSNQEFRDLGFAAMVDNLAVISVEWADKVAGVLKQYIDEVKIVWIKIEAGQSENERIITYSDHIGITN